MKFNVETEINQPLEKVVELFDNPDNMKQWMQGLESFKHLEGIPGQPGAKSRLTFKIGKREMVMTETILIRNLPDEFSGSYDTNGVHSIVKNRFKKISDNKTLYITENEFQLRGFVKIISLLMPGIFKKQSLKYLHDFKKFAESR